jgi:hypothetical protein
LIEANTQQTRIIEASEKQTVLQISQQVKESIEKQSVANEIANETAQKLLQQIVEANTQQTRIIEASEKQTVLQISQQVKESIEKQRVANEIANETAQKLLQQIVEANTQQTRIIEASEKQTVLQISQQVKESIEKQSVANEIANETAQKLLQQIVEANTQQTRIIEASEKQTVLQISQQVKESIEKQSVANEIANERYFKGFMSALDDLTLHFNDRHVGFSSSNDEVKRTLDAVSDKSDDSRSVINVILTSLSSGFNDILTMLLSIRSEQKVGSDDLKQKLTSLLRSLQTRNVDERPSSSIDEVDSHISALHLSEKREGLSSLVSNVDDINEKLDEMAHQLNESVSVGNVVLANVAAYSSDGILSVLNNVLEESRSNVKDLKQRYEALEFVVVKMNSSIDEIKTSSLESNLVIASRLESIRKTLHDVKKSINEKIDDCKTSITGVVEKLLDEHSTVNPLEALSIRSDYSLLESKIDEFSSMSTRAFDTMCSAALQTKSLLEPFVLVESDQRTRERGNLSAIAETVCEIQAMLVMHLTSKTPQRIPHSASRGVSSRLETPSK